MFTPKFKIFDNVRLKEFESLNQLFFSLPNDQSTNQSNT